MCADADDEAEDAEAEMRRRVSIAGINQLWEALLTSLEGVARCRDEHGEIQYALIRENNARSAKALAASDVGTFLLGGGAAFLLDVLAQRRHRRQAAVLADKVSSCVRRMCENSPGL